jgi:hypothetical protein
MEILACQHCGDDTPARFNFCVSCEKQIRCLDPDCKESVYPGKEMCLGCGKPLVVKVAANQNSNHLVRKVKQTRTSYEEHTELSVSDVAVGTLAPLFGAGHFMPPPKQPFEIPKRPIVNTPGKQGNLFALAAGNQEGGPANGGDKEGTDEEESRDETQEQQNTSAKDDEPKGQQTGAPVKFFEVHDGVLVANTKDFKGQSWAEQQNNFLALYLNAHYVAFNKPVPNSEHLRTASELVGVIDKRNFSRHLEKFLNAYIMTVTGGIKLNNDGQIELQRVLALMGNKDSKPGMRYWSRTPAPAQSAPRVSENDKAKVSGWLGDDVDLGQLDIRMLKSPSDYVLLTLWIITKHLGKAEAITSGEAFTYLISKYNTVSIEPGQFRVAFKNNKGKLFNLNKSNNTWFLTPEGEERVKSWVSGQAKSFQKKQAE